jgi:hypothetical protein
MNSPQILARPPVSEIGDREQFRAREIALRLLLADEFGVRVARPRIFSEIALCPQFPVPHFLLLNRRSLSNSSVPAEDKRYKNAEKVEREHHGKECQHGSEIAGGG